jgi:hypothetical protein
MINENGELHPLVELAARDLFDRLSEHWFWYPNIYEAFN